MLIPISLRNIRTAIGLAQDAAKQKLEADKAKLTEAAFNQLHDGAVHNGLKPTPDQIQNMHDMVDRDVVHAMGEHESTAVLEHLDTMMQMANYYETHDEDADGVVIADAEFRLLKDFLNGDKD